MKEQYQERHLSRREFQVMLDLARGKRIKVIAHQRGLSSKTISTYRTRLLLKLGLVSNTDLVHYCLKYGLLKKSSKRMTTSNGTKRNSMPCGKR